MSQIHEKLKMSHMNQTLTLFIKCVYILGPAGGFLMLTPLVGSVNVEN